MDNLREVYRKGGRHEWCQFMTVWRDNPPKFIHVRNPETNESFVAAQRMGIWAEVDINEIVMRLNGNWPELDFLRPAPAPDRQTS